MRLLEQQKNAIKQKALKYFGDDVNVYIFGSRMDDTKRGGDIDIYIKAKPLDNMLDVKIDYLQALEGELGKQKIDVVIDDGKAQKVIYEIARREGVEL
ncbi:MAG: nucleotidyltransferase domain-containing protein [Campylobacterales bacterium]